MWNFPLFPEQGSTTAGKVDALMLFEIGILTFFTTMILLLILGLGIRYRRGSKVDRSNPPTHDNRMETLWIVVPVLISAVMFVWGVSVFFEIYSPPPDAVEVNVVAKQWMWKLQHPEGKKEINELHVPLGQAIKLTMISQDVIHSFFLPAFRVKQDVLPGRQTELWFRPEKVGTYHLFCAEYCGTDHSVMGGYVHVMEPSDFERWLHEGQSTSMAREGEKLFVEYHCAGCHGASQTVKAPRLEGVYGKPVPILKADNTTEFVQADYRYIRDSILLPRSQVVAGYEPIMPSFQGRISEEDLSKIIAYIQSIGSKSAPQETIADAHAMEQARREADQPPTTPKADANPSGEGQQP